MRGQHLYLAVTVRSSSHPKTNKYWGLVWLFLALNTNYIRLYSWKWVKILLRPFCTHFSYPQSRILSPYKFIALENCGYFCFILFSRFAMELELMVKPRTMMLQGNILIDLCPDQLLKNWNKWIKFSLLNVQDEYFS